MKVYYHGLFQSLYFNFQYQDSVLQVRLYNLFAYFYWYYELVQSSLLNLLPFINIFDISIILVSIIL
jgi:hypothetical protein